MICHRVRAPSALLSSAPQTSTIGYYTDAGVQLARGLASQPPQPAGYELTTFDESRLEPVKRRGKLWRIA